jgi:PE family
VGSPSGDDFLAHGRVAAWFDEAVCQIEHIGHGQRVEFCRVADDLPKARGYRMSFVNASPQALAQAASDLANIGSTINQANEAAAAATAEVPAPAADQVSAAVAALLGGQAQDYQAVSSQLAAFHGQFVQALTGSATSYANTEAANASSMRNTSQG